MLEGRLREGFVRIRQLMVYSTSRLHPISLTISQGAHTP